MDIMPQARSSCCAPSAIRATTSLVINVSVAPHGRTMKYDEKNYIFRAALPTDKFSEFRSELHVNSQYHGRA
jgi:hypothetical protein